ncbi:class I SAM-dependent methyltransferase [Sorangium sp. So ce1128]
MSSSLATNVIDHFTARAPTYDTSSRWCRDSRLGALVLDATAPRGTDRVLDVACGTGLVSQLFQGRVAIVTGVDITPAMFEQARDHVDELVEAAAECLPFADNSFDIVVTRQGLQFMDHRRAVGEMVRVARPGGRVCLIQLCAYGEEDRDEYFEILSLRNPARRNFYLREDLLRLLADAGCRETSLREHVSVEDVEAWADNGAIDEEQRRKIGSFYDEASEAFRRLHAIERTADGRLVDHMLFGIAVGTK